MNKNILILVVVGVLALLGLIWALTGPSAAVAEANTRLFIDAETGETFRHELEPGETVPLYSSSSGGDNGYPAELCYWTADGGLADDPTPVLLNEFVGKPGPTACPDCGRLVVQRGPRPRAGDPPPPLVADLGNAPAVPGRDRDDRD